jgi:hypothetical protein
MLTSSHGTFVRLWAVALACAFVATSCKPVNKSRASAGAPEAGNAAPFMFQARQDAARDVINAQAQSAPSAEGDTAPVSEPLVEASMASAMVQGVDEAMKEAEVQSETMGMIGMPMEACKKVLNDWALLPDDVEGNEHPMAQTACVGTFVGTFFATVYGVQKLSRAVKEIRPGARVNNFLKKAIKEPVWKLHENTKGFLKSAVFNTIGGQDGANIANQMKPTYEKASAAVRLNNPKWSELVIKRLAKDGGDAVKLFEKTELLERELADASANLSRLLQSNGASHEVERALKDVSAKQTALKAQNELNSAARDVLRAKAQGGSNPSALSPLEANQLRALDLKTAQSEVFQNHVRLQQQLTQLSTDAESYRAIVTDPKTGRPKGNALQGADPPNAAMYKSRMLKTGKDIVATKREILNATGNVRKVGLDVPIQNVDDYKKVVDSIDEMANLVPDNAQQLVDESVQHADDVAKFKTTNTGFYGMVAQDASGPNRLALARKVGGGAINGGFRVWQIRDSTVHGFSAVDAFKEERPGKGYLQLAFAALPWACAAGAAAVTVATAGAAGVVALPAMLACTAVVDVAGGMALQSIGNRLDRQWDAKLERRGLMNELAILGECTQSRSDSEMCQAVREESAQIINRATVAFSAGKDALSEEQVRNIAAGDKSNIPTSVVGNKPEKYDQPRYMCNDGGNIGRSYKGGEKVLLRKSDIANKDASRVNVTFVSGEQGPFLISKSLLCASYRPDVEAQENNTAPTTGTKATIDQLTDPEKERGSCVVKIWQDAGDRHVAINCEKLGAEMSKKNNGDYSCERNNLGSTCRCRFNLNRTIANTMRYQCEIQQGTFTPSR